ncbi:N-acetyltransferase 6 [Aphelenchoides besseyi]|nr:N-acetyltransferase 6 [Aphelenchoides besseyi]KAI6201111.1 N-acetyltransferase 6 [Aphelenchoides besseyi]
MMTHDCQLVALSERKDLIEECVRLINEEWPKSHSSRLLSVERAANFEPPMAFVLLSAEEEQLIGYGRFLRILNYNGNAALLDTIVIKRELRGQGYGRILMNLLKAEAIGRDYELLIISTDDKQQFYEKCGYKCCKFLNLLTSNIAQSNGLSDSMRFDRPIPTEPNERIDERTSATTISSSSIPSPPPLFESMRRPQNTSTTQYMFHYLTGH